MFEVRENYADISFIRNYLTKDLVKDLDVYVFEKKGPVYLKHQFEGVELDLKYAERTLPYVYQLWGKTVVEDKTLLFMYDEKKVGRKFL